jgi:hypothetical protein
VHDPDDHLGYALHGDHQADVDERRVSAPWYQTKTNPSFGDVLAELRRTIIARVGSAPPNRHHRNRAGKS